MRTKDKWLELQDILREFFSAQGFEILGDFDSQKLSIDLAVRSEKSLAAIEIKVWSSKHIRLSALLSAAAHVENARKKINATHGVIIITAVVDDEISRSIRDQFSNIRIFDLETLNFIFSHYPSLARRFSELMADISVQSNERTDRGSSVNTASFGDIIGDITAPTEDLRGPRRDFCAELRAVPEGKKGWQKFEAVCFDALQYCLGEDLARWKKQHRTYSGINIFDAVCRISSDHDFWIMTSHRFNCGYIVFEFKNYSKRISQDQIYSTEKYLYIPAIRTVAFIVSRHGFDQNAAKASAGALRENGKLIIDLPMETVCAMVEAKDENEDVNMILFNLVDDLLFSLER